MRFAFHLLRSSPQLSKVVWQEAPISRCRYSAAWGHTLKRYVSNTELQPGNPAAAETQIQEDSSEGEDVLKTRNIRQVECPENSKYMKISIIGLPNAGKSTIINALTTYDVCPVSKRPHTTRNNQQAVFLDQETQLVFIDTPGVVNVKEIKKFGFSEEFVFGPEKSIGRAHLIAVMHDVSNSATRDKLDFRIKGVLKKFPDKKSVLILNKIDKVTRKDTLLDTMKYLTCGYVGGKPLPVTTFNEKKQSHLRMNTEEILSKAKRRHDEIHSSPENQQLLIAKKFFTDNEIEKGVHEQGWPHFNDVFMVSALEEDGIDLLRRYLILNAVPEPWLFDSETLTNVPPMKLTLKMIQAKLLEHLPQEIPFKVKPVIEFWNENESGELCISIKLRCPKERYKWRIIGTGGALINKITEDTQAALSRVMSQPVKLTLNPELDPQLASLEK